MAKGSSQKRKANAATEENSKAKRQKQAKAPVDKVVRKAKAGAKAKTQKKGKKGPKIAQKQNKSLKTPNKATKQVEKAKKPSKGTKNKAVQDKNVPKGKIAANKKVKLTQDMENTFETLSDPKIGLAHSVQKNLGKLL